MMTKMKFIENLFLTLGKEKIFKETKFKWVLKMLMIMIG